MAERAVKLGLPALLTYNQVQKGPGDGGNRPGVWPHLIWRYDVSNASAPAIGGVA